MSSPNYNLEEFPAAYMKSMALCELEGDDYVSRGDDSLGRFYVPRLMAFLQDVFSSGKCRGKILMDMCCGPTIHGVMAASSQFSEIYLTEFAEINRRAVERWWRRDTTTAVIDWSPYFEYVAKNEGCSAQVVEDRLRKAVRGVYACDLMDEQPLGDFVPPKVDCLLSILTLVAAAKTPQAYRDIAKRIAGYIKPGGSLVLVGLLGSQYYVVDGVKLENCPVEEEFVRACLSEAGFEVEQYEQHPVPPSPQVNPGIRYYFLVARRV